MMANAGMQIVTKSYKHSFMRWFFVLILGAFLADQVSPIWNLKDAKKYWQLSK